MSLKIDFTLKTYEQLLLRIQATNHHTYTIRDFFQQDLNDSEKKIILRHDVDRRPLNALKMAELEASLGLRSTYYFRHMKHTFKPELIKKIAGLGHEVGYHYETLAKARGDYAKAYSLFKNELDDFRKIAEVNTICMHGRPLSPWDNRDLWTQYNFNDLGIIGEPYLSIDYTNIIYLTDTGRRWDGDKVNLRDKVEQKEKPRTFAKTHDIYEYLPNNKQTLILQTHPERWAHSPQNLVWSYGIDKATNCIKRMMRLIS